MLLCGKVGGSQIKWRFWDALYPFIKNILTAKGDIFASSVF